MQSNLELLNFLGYRLLSKQRTKVNELIQYVILFQVAGGDGTVGWCLSSVGALREISATTSIPPLGIIPLGTGNDLSRSFGWVRAQTRPNRNLILDDVSRYVCAGIETRNISKICACLFTGRGIYFNG